MLPPQMKRLRLSEKLDDSFMSDMHMLEDEQDCTLIHAAVAEHLLHKGFSVAQVLMSCEENQKFHPSMTSEDVCREVVLPETADEPSCYMDSFFMRSRGGPKKATTFVEQVQRCTFMNTLINILLVPLVVSSGHQVTCAVS